MSVFYTVCLLLQKTTLNLSALIYDSETLFENL